MDGSGSGPDFDGSNYVSPYGQPAINRERFRRLVDQEKSAVYGAALFTRFVRGLLHFFVRHKFRNFAYLAVEELAQLVQIISDRAVAPLIDHL